MKNVYSVFNLFLISSLLLSCNFVNEKKETKELKISKKTKEEKATATEERWLYEFNMEKDPSTGLVPRGEKLLEFENALIEKQSNSAFKTNTNTYISRGPSNLGGRTRSIKVDISDTTGKTIIAGGVSSGVFRTTDGGNSWTKVSSFDEIHNVTTIAQDPRDGFQNIWYYGTGEFSGNSASSIERYNGNGIWKSTDSGQTWQQISETASGDFQTYDNDFDYIIDLEVSPTTGELFVGTVGKILKLTSSGIETELQTESNSSVWTDIAITSSGRVYASIGGRATFNTGIWTSSNGDSPWTNIAFNPTPTGWDPARRITVAVAPSNENLLYVLYDNGSSNSSSSPKKEADLFQYNQSTNSWIDYSSKLPDEIGGDSPGNDPFSIQGSYDLVISVKPDDENFVVIGGTNIYKIDDITTDEMFGRIGGYLNPTTYSIYNRNGVNHHPDIHAIEWSNSDNSVMYSGTDGGVHKTNNITNSAITWENLNNNYLTYQYYHVNMVNVAGDDFVMGGAQDNGTTIGGSSTGQSDKSTMSDYWGGDGASVGVVKSSENDGYTLYVSTQNGRILRGNETQLTADIQPIERYDDNNDPVNYNSQFVTYFYLDPENTSTIYYASKSKLLRTNDAENVDGDSWEDLGSLPLSENISTIEASGGTYDVATSFILVGGGGGNVFRINDPKNITDLSGIVNITPADIPLENGVSDQYASDISIHPTNKDIAIVTYSNYGSDVKNIFITNNATSETPTWTNVESNLVSHSIRAAAITELNGTITYFVGTARGLYSSSDPTTQDWTLEGGDVMGIPLVSSLVYRDSDKTLLVGTHGNGMYETNLNSVLSVDDNSIDLVKIALYPNPAQFQLHFASKNINLNDDTKFEIYDIKGKNVSEGNLNNKSIDISNLSRGMYIVKLNKDNTLISRKFVKN